MIKLVPIRVLFNEQGNQACDTGDETCHFYVSFQSSHWCNHCQRGITNGVPHRLCPLNDPVHPTPPQRTWVELTDKETLGFNQHEMSVVKYVNKVLREKNT